MKLLKEQLMKISKALVFDIKRFAIHDGSGLRTTVFFKGCPLRCLWCQNPEGLNTQRQVIYFKNKCIHCRCCQQFKEQINYQNDRPYFQNHQDFDQVIKTCPSGAIQYDSQEYTLDKLMNKIKEDEVLHFLVENPLCKVNFLLKF
jgi:pyruvate formate lyase activating enzyme